MASDILRKGSKGQSVKILQDKLKAAGFLSENPDGIFGGNTEKAVRAFQKSHGLDEDGEVGPKTRAELNKVTFGPGTLRVTNPKGTSFKQSTKQAKDLQQNDLYPVKPDATFDYSSIAPGDFEGHYKVHFEPALDHENRGNTVQTWYVYSLDVKVV